MNNLLFIINIINYIQIDIYDLKLKFIGRK